MKGERGVLDSLPRDEGFAGQFLPELPESDVIEVPLLLPGWQMSALEHAAHNRGLTAGEMVRHLLRDFFIDALPGEAKVG